MDKYGYTLKQKTKQPQEGMRYHETDLLLMTTFQLQEICRREKIIQGIVNPMDREELIHVILRFRGADEYFLIGEADENGMQALERLIKTVSFNEKQDQRLTCSSRITAYEGLEIGIYDGLTIPYEKRFAGTNALVVGGDMTLCAVLNVVPAGNGTEYLYLTKPEGISCRESSVKNYSLYLMGQRESELLYRIYSGTGTRVPETMEVCRIPLLDFEVRKPVPLSMPVAMDFGTSNTTAAVYLDNRYFEEAGLHDGECGLKENDVNYALFYDANGGFQESTLLPSVVGILSVEEGAPCFLFGYDAIRLAQSSYIDEGFCVFYDIKRWISDYEKQEEITDRQGRRGFLPRKSILKAYFTYVLKAVKNRFKCEIHGVHISCPVKQKAQFIKLFAEILPDYAVEGQEMIDEGVSVLYNTISGMIQSGSIRNGEEYKALVIDCGGGTTDLCSCSFRVWDRRAAYQIEIETSYENGDTDFGGNNLTYRIMQLLKIAIVNRLYPGAVKPEAEILSGYDTDVYRLVDRHGTEEVYKELEGNYQKAESYLPTRFRDFEHKSRADYFRVKNNFYFLFHLSETIKKEFYLRTGVLRAAVASGQIEESGTVWIPADKWKLSIREGDSLKTAKEFPVVYLTIYELELLLRADIYGVMRRFMEKMYEQDALEQYSVIRLTGQSCRIGLFRDALKEYIPGKVIRTGQRSGNLSRELELKMSCVDGALKYLKDKRYGFADIHIHTKEPALPYRITAYTHSGEEAVLIDRLKRGGRSGMISRNMENLTLKLCLKDLDGKERYQYTCYSMPEDFRETEYEQIRERYGEHILQADTDDIAENEARFFVWTSPEDWAFTVVPVCRRQEKLCMGKEETFFFENEGWVRNFFDGTK